MTTKEIEEKLRRVIKSGKETSESLYGMTMGKIMSKYFPELLKFDWMKVYIAVNDINSNPKNNKKMRIKIVKWKNVINQRKHEKYGFFTGTIGEIKMINQILKTIGVSGVIIQIIKMRRLRVK